MQELDRTLRSYLSFLENEYISSAISLFLVVYAGMAAPKLPEHMANLLKIMWFRLLMFALVAYTSKINQNVAIIAAIGLVVSLQTLNKYEVQNDMMQVAEHFGDMHDKFITQQNK
jgi:hypothetical protein